MKITLSFQLDNMRPNRFEEWFDRELKSIFGKFITKDSKVQLLETIRADKYYYFSGMVWVAIVGIAGYFFCKLYDFPVPIMIKRLVDNLIVIGFGGWTFIRYVVMSTLFIDHYSRLSLKPMLIKLNHEGLRSFAPLVILNIVASTAIWALIIMLCYLEITQTYVYDFFFVTLGSLILLIWSVGMPFMMHRAAQTSKSKAVLEYSKHIDEGFKAFLKNPSDNTANRYKWLVNNQMVVKGISTWPLSWAQTIFAIIGCNVFMCMMTVFYVIQRTGQWNSIKQWLNAILLSL
jgi:hypothetical protein